MEHLNIKQNIVWPKINEQYLINEKINFVVQINGRKREVLKIDRDLSEKEIMVQIYSTKTLEKYIKDILIKKKIFVPNRLINIIV